MRDLDSIMLEILWGRLIAIVDEASVTLVLAGRRFVDGIFQPEEATWAVAA